MLLSFGISAIEIASWPDRAALINHLARCNLGQCMLGKEVTHPRAFYSTTMYLGWAEQDKFGIGLCAEGHGLMPQLLLQPEHERLLLGFNSQVAVFQFPAARLGPLWDLETLFHRFVWLGSMNRILVQHEIGILALTESLEVAWQFSQDVITRLEVVGTDLCLTFMDSGPARLRLLDGSLYDGRRYLDTRTAEVKMR